MRKFFRLGNVDRVGCEEKIYSDHAQLTGKISEMEEAMTRQIGTSSFYAFWSACLTISISIFSILIFDDSKFSVTMQTNFDLSTIETANAVAACFAALCTEHKLDNMRLMHESESKLATREAEHLVAFQLQSDASIRALESQQLQHKRDANVASSVCSIRLYNKVGSITPTFLLNIYGNKSQCHHSSLCLFSRQIMARNRSH